jgi:hypothetical protein
MWDTTNLNRIKKPQEWWCEIPHLVLKTENSWCKGAPLSKMNCHFDRSGGICGFSNPYYFLESRGRMIHAPNPLIAIGVVASTAATDAVYVFFTAAVAARRRSIAASWSSVWYLLSAFAVISYTGNPIYVVFAAIGSWLGAFGAVTWLGTADVKSASAKPHS